MKPTAELPGEGVAQRPTSTIEVSSWCPHHLWGFEVRIISVWDVFLANTPAPAPPKEASPLAHQVSGSAGREGLAMWWEGSRAGSGEEAGEVCGGELECCGVFLSVLLLVGTFHGGRRLGHGEGSR